MRYRPTYNGEFVLIGRWWIRLSDGLRIPAIQGGGKAVTNMRTPWAFGDDDGSESGHTLDTANVHRTTAGSGAMTADTPFLLRCGLEETAGGSEVQGYELFAVKNGGATYTAVTTSRTDGIRIANDTNSRADDENTTERLSAGSGTWTAGKYDDGQTQQGTTAITLSNNYTDVEFCIEIDSANASNGDYWDFRVEFSGGGALDSYPGTLPRVEASVLVTPTISVSDNTGVTDSPTVALDDLEISVSDNVGVTDAAPTVSTEQDSYSISVSDNVNVADAPSVFIPEYNISVSDNVGVSDSPSVDKFINLPFWDGVESADERAWTGEQNVVSYTSAAALEGTVGIETSSGGSAPYLYGQWENGAQTHYGSFKFHTNNVAGVTDDYVNILEIYDGTQVIAEIRFGINATGKYLMVRAIQDGLTFRQSSAYQISDNTEYFVEFELVNIATSGTMTLWLDGTQVAQATGVDSDTLFADEVRFGKPTVGNEFTSGEFYLDSLYLTEGAREFGLHGVSDNTGVTDTLPTYYYDNVVLGEYVNVEIVAPSGDREIGVSDNTGVTDSASVVLDDLEIAVSDNVNVGESHSLKLEDLQISVSDNVDLGESYDVKLEDLQISVSDNVNVGESYNVTLLSFIQATDNVNVADSAQVDYSLEIAVSDNVNVADSPQVTLDDLEIDVADNVDVADSPTPPDFDPKKISVSDNVNVADSPFVTSQEFQIFVSDNVVVADSVTVVEPDPREISVSDNANVTDSVQIALDDLEIAVSDNVNVADVATVATTSDVFEISVSDNTAVADAAQVALDDLEIQVSDDVGVSDSAEVNVSDLEINVSDNVNVADAASLSLSLDISVSDNVGVSDILTFAPIDLNISVSDAIDVTDEFDRIRIVGQFESTISVELEPRSRRINLSNRTLEVDLEPRSRRIDLDVN